MPHRRIFEFRTCLLSAILFAGRCDFAGAAEPASVRLVRTPDGGIQPQAVVDRDATVHLLYFKGKPAAGDLFYARLGKEQLGNVGGDGSFSPPIQVNRRSGAAIAVGTIRGGQIAVGRAGRVHVAWNGSGETVEDKGMDAFMKTSMLYTRLNDDGSAFEPERNLIQSAYGLDGGGTVAADPNGNVCVAWHAVGGDRGEESRRVYVARSTDDGKTFAAEKPAFSQQTGACGCCGMKAVADDVGHVFMLYRSARQKVNRDMFLLASRDNGKTFQGVQVDRWAVAQCPMSSESFAVRDGGVVAAWETEGQVYLAAVSGETLKAGKPVAAPGSSRGRKHPSLAIDRDGRVLLAWAEGTGWQKGGSLAWQVFDKQLKPTSEKGRADGIPMWSLPAAIAQPEGGFVIVH
jgi:hypothetical protein